MEYTSLSALLRWPRNAKRHAIEDLDASMQRFGFTEPFVVDEGTGRLVAGHGRLETLEVMKRARKRPPARVEARADDWYVPVLRGIGFADEREAEAYLLASNRLTEKGGYDKAVLFEQLGYVADSDAGLEGVGWTGEDLAKMEPHEAAVEEVDVSELAHAEFFMSVRGPLPAQPEAIERLRAALEAMPGVNVEVGIA